MARFVILEKIGGKNRVYLEYNEQQFIMRLKARTMENLSIMTDFKKEVFTKEQIDKAITKAFADMAKEFKERTVIVS